VTTANYQDRIGSLYGRDVYDRDGNKIGSIGQIYADHSGQPSWASVHTGLFGMKETLVPLHGAGMQGDDVRVAYDKATVKDAPNIDKDTDEPLQGDEVRRLYEHYKLGWETGSGSGSGYTGNAGEYSGNAGQHSGNAGQYSGNASGYSGTTSGSGANRGDARTDGAADRSTGRSDNAMTRSEEQLNVGTQTERTGTARLRKYVVTENVQTTVPVQREEVRLEREPVTDANSGAAYSGSDISEAEHEVTLHAERPVVQKETVPVERVRLGKQTVTDQQTVGGDVRKERIDADLPDEDGSRRLD
jgi:uncharacterized protein (TIGR02271 family)